MPYGFENIYSEFIEENIVADITEETIFAEITEETIEVEITEETLLLEVVDTEEVIGELGAEDIIVEVDSFSCPETPGGFGGGGYNFINISSPVDGIDVGQSENVTITGTTMRNSGADEADPVVTIDGTEVAVTPVSGDANIFRFSHETMLTEGGENLIPIISDNNSLRVTKFITVVRDDYVDTFPPETIADITGDEQDGWYITNPIITLTATDDYSGIDKTYYRLNGGSVQIYSAPITVANQGPNVLEFWSEDNNGNVEEIKTVSWQTDSEPPVSTLATTGDHFSGDWYKSEVNITVNATDTAGVDKTFIAVDDGSFIEANTHLFASEGSHTIDYYSVDILGQVENTKSENINIDMTAPTSNISVIGSKDQGWYTSLPEVTLSASDAITGVKNIYYRVNGGSWQIYSAPAIISQQGSVTFEYYAEDNNGNSENIKTETWQTDTAAPVSTINLTGTHYEGDWYRSYVTTDISVIDSDSGVDRTFYSINGGSFVEGNSYNFNTDGQHNIRYYSMDILGNTEAVKTQNINIDTTPVNIDNIVCTHTEWYKNDGTVTITVNVGEDTTGWSGNIDLSAFGGNSSENLIPSGNSLYINFTPVLQDATGSPAVEVFDRGGNSDTGNAPILNTYLYRVNPQTVYFPPFSDTSEVITGSFTTPANVHCEWASDYSREGDLIYNEGFTVVDGNKIKLLDKWIDDVMSNSLGNMGVSVYEQ